MDNSWCGYGVSAYIHPHPQGPRKTSTFG
ncbi:unnamed protein product [Rotaria magnacalcarata]|uniref:Uncharacterized protein n=1 Tax=Rotaria magnacalcarata TaxID=392030 RepID=A0A8S3DLW5_9BILA|nr:unnamed protein product [Rotaria magnacalcarata]